MSDSVTKAILQDKRLKEALKANLVRRKRQAVDRLDNPAEQATGVAYSGRVGFKKQTD